MTDGNSLDYQIARLRRLWINDEPAELRRYLAVPHAVRPRFVGTAIPVIIPWIYHDHPSGLVVARRPDATIMDEATATYVTADEYLDFSSELVIRYALGRVPSIQLVQALAVLNWLLLEPDAMERWREEYAAGLHPEIGARLTAAMRSDDIRRAFLGRQGVLHAMRLALLADEVTDPYDDDAPPIVVATLLVHGVSTFLSVEDDDADDSFFGVSTSVAMELVQNSYFHRANDPLTEIARYSLLWRYYGGRLERHSMTVPPTVLLEQITGLTFDELLTMGFAVYGYARCWQPDKPIWLNADLGQRFPATKVDAFWAVMARDREEFAGAFQARGTRWGLLPFHTTPTMREGGRVLILDPLSVLDRVLSGLYWIVHDHVKQHQGERERHRWTQVHGEMVEGMVRDYVRSFALPTTGDATFYAEDAFARAYPGHKIPDAGIDYGDVVCLFEAVSGQLSAPTWLEGRFDAFERDTERIVLKKARQLDDACACVLRDESRLTGHPPVVERRVLPVIVVGEGYPLNPLSYRYVTQKLATAGLFQHPRIYPLAIIDVRELEMLVGLAEHGHSIVGELLTWLSSPHRAMFLRNDLIRRHGAESGSIFRPRRLRSEFDRLTSVMADLIGPDSDAA